jgi:hypothetical protein
MSAKKPPDFAAAREDLHAVIAANAAALETADNRLGELALDCQLGNSPPAELDAAQAERDHLQSKADVLAQALAAVDRREQAAQAEQATAEHARLERELAKAEAEIHTTAVAALAALGAFATAAGKLVAAERKALNIAGKLGASRRYGAGPELRNATLAALSTDAAPLLAQQPPGSYDRAAARLLALKKVEVV